MRKILDGIIEVSQGAEHNRRICDVLERRVYAVDLATFEYKVRRNQELFNKKIIHIYKI